MEAQTGLRVGQSQVFFGLGGEPRRVDLEELVDEGKEERRPVALGCDVSVKEEVDDGGVVVIS